MGTDNLKAQAYPLDQGWGPDSGWKSGGGSFDRDWGPDNGWSRQAESAKTRPGNGGASFVAWEQQTEAVPELADWPPPDRLRLPEASPPGFYIVPRSMSGERVLALLFTDKPHSHLVNRIKALNPTFAQGFKAGEMFILGNLLNPTACLREEADLMAAAAKVRAALEPLSEAEADFMARHQAEIALMLGGAGASLGLGTDVLKKGLRQVGETLRDIEYLHQREFVTHGHLQSSQFFTGRQQLYRQLDNQLKATLLGQQLGLGSHSTLRRDLGISTRSLVHHWSKGGAPGQIPGYATHMNEVAKAAKYLKYGGYIGIALTGTASSIKVQEVCRAGETEACERIRFTEAGSFVGGIGGGSVGVWIAGGAAPYLCGAIGLASGGLGGIVCGLVVVGGASYAGGKGGEWTGEWMGREYLRGAEVIDINSWPLKLQIAFGLAPFVIGLSGVAIGVYIACSRHFEIMLSALSNSAWAQQSRILGTTSLASRCYLVSTLSGALVFPQYLVRKGVLDAGDVNNFPPALRRLMVMSMCLAYAGMAWLLLLMGLLKLSGVEWCYRGTR